MTWNVKVGKKGMSRRSFKEVKHIFKDGGCKLLSKEGDYEGSTTRLRYRCNCGNISYTLLSSFIKGSRCRECGEKKRQKTNLEKYGTRFPMLGKIKKKTKKQANIPSKIIEIPDEDENKDFKVKINNKEITLTINLAELLGRK